MSFQLENPRHQEPRTTMQQAGNPANIPYLLPTLHTAQTHALNTCTRHMH